MSLDPVNFPTQYYFLEFDRKLKYLRVIAKACGDYEIRSSCRVSLYRAIWWVIIGMDRKDVSRRGIVQYVERLTSTIDLPIPIADTQFRTYLIWYFYES